MAGRDPRDATVAARDPRLVTILLIAGVGIVGIEPVAVALPGIGGSLGVPDAALGLVMTAFFLGAAVATPAVGTLADVVGRRPLVLVALGIYAVGGVAAFLVDGFAALLALRAIQGVGFAGTTPLTVVIVGDQYRGTAGSTVQGLRLSANGVSGLVTPAIAGVLAGLGWRYPFLLFLLAVPVAILVYRYLPEPPAVGDTGSPAGGDLRAYAAAITAEAGDRTMLVVIMGGVVAFFARYGVLTFAPLYAVRSLGATAIQAGLLVAVLGVVRLVGAPFVGHLVERSHRKRLLVASATLAGTSAAAITLAPGVLPLGGVLAAYAVGGVVLIPVVNDTVSNLAVAETRGGLVSGMNLIKILAMAASPAVFGAVLAAWGFTAVFVGVGVVALLYGVAAAALVDATRVGF